MSSQNKSREIEEIILLNRLCQIAYKSYVNFERTAPNTPRIFHVNEKINCDAEDLAIQNFVYGKEGMRLSLLIGVMGCGVLGAFVFRQARLAAKVRLWQQRKPATYHLDEIDPPAVISNRFRQNSKTTGFMPPRPHFLLRSIGMIGDGLVGCTLFNVLMVYYYVPKTRTAFERFLPNVPLVEGCSFMSEAVCDNVVREIQTNQALFRDGVQHPGLKIFEAFAENCQRRRAYEAHLRKAKGYRPDALVMVPPPGVPPDFPLSDEGDVTKQVHAEIHDWAASYTNDQEANARKK
jgi:hypothetical protein